MNCFGFMALATTLAVVPVSKLTSASWRQRHETITKEIERCDAQVVFLGDSITEGWLYTKEWSRYKRFKPVNGGISSDRVENLLWRVRNGAIGCAPKVVVLLIGANNVGDDPERVAAGVQAIVDEIHARTTPVDVGWPPAERKSQTQALLLGVFPQGRYPADPRRDKIKAINKALGCVTGTFFWPFGEGAFTDINGEIRPDVMRDGVHLTDKGYRLWADGMAGPLDTFLNEE